MKKIFSIFFFLARRNSALAEEGFTREEKGEKGDISGSRNSALAEEGFTSLTSCVKEE